MKLAILTRGAVLVLAAGLTLGGGRAAAQSADVTFYYPVAVGGPVTKIIDGLAADFTKENPGIKVKPIYAGTYAFLLFQRQFVQSFMRAGIR